MNESYHRESQIENRKLDIQGHVAQRKARNDSALCLSDLKKGDVISIDDGQ
jgi:hypothetical protein